MARLNWTLSADRRDAFRCGAPSFSHDLELSAFGLPSGSAGDGVDEERSAVRKWVYPLRATESAQTLDALRVCVKKRVQETRLRVSRVFVSFSAFCR